MAPTGTETPAVPPKFIPDSMQYSLWKKEVNMWSHVTNIQCVKARKLQCHRKKSDQKPTVRRKALFGTLPMKLRKSYRVFVKEEKKRRSEKFSRRMRKGEYKNLVLKILSEEFKETVILSQSESLA